jgi:hypothetical protein
MMAARISLERLCLAWVLASAKLAFLWRDPTVVRASGRLYP